MITKAEVKKLIDARFETVTVKYESRKGREVCLRYSDGKIVKYIPTGVSFNSSNWNDKKLNAIQEKSDEIRDYLKELGGKLTIISGNEHLIFEFESGFDVHVIKHNVRSSMMYDDPTQDIYFSISFVE